MLQTWGWRKSSVSSAWGLTTAVIVCHRKHRRINATSARLNSVSASDELSWTNFLAVLGEYDPFTVILIPS
jgi:hypothetical protein